jgi:hypothetical protein
MKLFSRQRDQAARAAFLTAALAAAGVESTAIENAAAANDTGFLTAALDREEAEALTQATTARDAAVAQRDALVAALADAGLTVASGADVAAAIKAHIDTKASILAAEQLAKRGIAPVKGAGEPAPTQEEADAALPPRERRIAQIKRELTRK